MFYYFHSYSIIIFCSFVLYLQNVCNSNILIISFCTVRIKSKIKYAACARLIVLPANADCWSHLETKAHIQNALLTINTHIQYIVHVTCTIKINTRIYQHSEYKPKTLIGIKILGLQFLNKKNVKMTNIRLFKVHAFRSVS